jgi:amino acid permease
LLVAFQHLVDQLFPLFAYTLQGAWALCLFLIVCPLFFRNKKKTDKTVSILRLSLAGILVYLLVSENNTRQLVNQLPLMFILAAFSLDPVMQGFKKLTHKALVKLEK